MLAGQAYVGRYDGYVGFGYLDSSNINLAERGVHVQAGVRMRSWYSVGFDYSYFNGHTSLGPELLPDALRQQLATQLGQLAAAGRLPPGYALTVPLDSTTETFAVGPQFAYRHWPAVTLFVRPSLGAIHEVATPKPADPIAAGIVAELTPSGEKQDWTGFYGAGGGVDFNLTPHFSIRVQGDYVYDHLFNDLLKDGRHTWRFSIGPGFQFGRNVR
jgi:hypothetical protein